MAHRSRTIRWLGYLTCLGVLVILPLSLNSYILHLLIIAGIWMLLVQGLNVILGYTGLLNVSQGALMGVGAYVSALLSVRLGWSFWLTMPTAIIITALVGLLIGFPALRTKGLYFAIVTLAWGLILFQLFNNLVSVTGGPNGLGDIPNPSPIPLGITNLSFDTKIAYYYLVLGVVLLVFLLIYRIAKSTLGRALIAVREDEILAETFGISSNKFKMIAFVICSALAGLAGTLYAHYMTFISPESFTIHVLIEVLTMLVIGSAGTVMGPLLGTFIVFLIPEALRFANEYRLLVYAVTLGIVILYMPQGLGKSISRVLGKIDWGRERENERPGIKESD